jgi:hypothetical protein
VLSLRVRRGRDRFAEKEAAHAGGSTCVPRLNRGGLQERSWEDERTGGLGTQVCVFEQAQTCSGSGAGRGGGDGQREGGSVVPWLQ